MILLVKLILAHLIGDFVLQPTHWVIDKEQHKIASPKLYLHLLIHAVLLFLFLWNIEFYLLILVLTLTHGVIDIAKLYLQNEENKITCFLLDQGFHLLSIFVLLIVFSKPELEWSNYLENPNLWIYSTALLFITFVAGIVIQILLANWSKAIQENEQTEKSLNQAGKYIGILERLLIFLFVILGRWEGVGFLLAAKSIFRFGDLNGAKDRKLTEYILIGSLLSFGLAIITALIVLAFTN